MSHTGTDIFRKKIYFGNSYQWYLRHNGFQYGPFAQKRLAELKLSTLIEAEQKACKTQRYEVHAFDVYGLELWIEAGSSHEGAVAHRPANSRSYAQVIINTTKTGQIIDQETGKPVTRRYNQETGKWSQGSRRVAYFRIIDENEIHEIYFTEYGRKSGVQNYQAYETGYVGSALITGHAPIQTGPRIVETGHSLQLTVGEGNPYDTLDENYLDRHGDLAYVIAQAHRVTLADSEGSWSGWFVEDIHGRNHFAAVGATKDEVKKQLQIISDDFVAKGGLI